MIFKVNKPRGPSEMLYCLRSAKTTHLSKWTINKRQPQHASDEDDPHCIVLYQSLGSQWDDFRVLEQIQKCFLRKILALSL